jgi:hypothetical protein
MMPPTNPMRALHPIVLFLLLPSGSIGAQTLPVHKPMAPKRRLFLQVRDQQLLLGALPFRNVGATIPDLLTRILRGDEVGAERTLRDARSAGIRFVRCAGLPRSPEVARTFSTDQARWFAAWDHMLAAAESHDMSLVPSLLYDPLTLPQIVSGTDGSVNTADLLTPGTPANKLAVAYVTAIVTRYRNDPRILFWEIGNEYNLLADLASADPAASPPANTPQTPEHPNTKHQTPPPVPTASSMSDRIRAFLAQMAALIHRLDRRHPVTSGNGDLPSYAAHLPHHWPDNKRYASVTSFSTEKDRFAQYQEMLDFFNPPGIDIISIHAHPPLTDKVFWLTEDDDTALRISWTQLACTNLGKPLFVGAFGQPTQANGTIQPTPWMQDFLRRMEAEGAPLSAVQSWEPGADAPSTNTDAISPARTPQLAFAVQVVNTVIANAQANNQVLPIGPPLDLSPAAMEAARQRPFIELLRAISATLMP